MSRYAAVQYMAHEHAKKLLYPEGYDKRNVAVHPVSRLCAGSIAGVISVCATYATSFFPQCIFVTLHADTRSTSYDRGWFVR